MKIYELVTKEQIRENNTTEDDFMFDFCPKDFGLKNWEKCNENAWCIEQCWKREVEDDQ